MLMTADKGQGVVVSGMARIRYAALRWTHNLGYRGASQQEMPEQTGWV